MFLYNIFLFLLEFNWKRFFLATDECEESRLLVEALDVSSKLYISSTDLCAKAQTTQFPRLETIINSKHVEIV